MEKKTLHTPDHQTFGKTEYQQVREYAQILLMKVMSLLGSLDYLEYACNKQEHYWNIHFN